MVPHNQCVWKDPFQLSQQCQQRSLLFQRAGIGRTTCGIQSPFIADADGVAVVMEAMCTDFLQRATAVNLAVTGDVEMIPDILEPAVTDVVSPAIFKAQAHALGRGRAMNNKQCNGTHTLLAGTET